MVMKELPAFCTSTSVMFGTIATKSRGDSMPADLIVCSVKASTVTGTLCSDSSRLRAVTTISCISPVAAGAAVCARVGTAAIIAITDVNAAIHLPRRILIIY